MKVLHSRPSGGNSIRLADQNPIWYGKICFIEDPISREHLYAIDEGLYRLKCTLKTFRRYENENEINL